MAYISSLVIRNDKLDKKRKKVNEFMIKKCLTKHFLFVDDENVKLAILNKSGLYLN